VRTGPCPLLDPSDLTRLAAGLTLEWPVRTTGG
jgi:hypothetical protein